MGDDDRFTFGRNLLGSALITGATGAGLGLSFARPFVAEGLEVAYATADGLRRAALEQARGNVRSLVEGRTPAFRQAMAAKDQLRRRAIGSLPPAVGGELEHWRREFIESEKALYFGSLRASQDLDAAFEVARARSKDVLQEAVSAFEDVAEAALATSIKLGEAVQEGELPKPPRPKPGKLKPKAARAKRRRRA